MTAPVHLYSMAICPFAQRTRILLRLKNIPFEITELDITRPSADWFLKLNPSGQVPVIQHAGIVLNESSIINEYLEEVFSYSSYFSIHAVPESDLPDHDRFLQSRVCSPNVPPAHEPGP